MNTKRMIAILCAALLASTAALPATPPPSLRAQASAKQTPTEILAASAERGKALMAALREYTYISELTIETVSQAETISGKYYRLSQISFDPAGHQQERVIDNSSTLPDDVNIGTVTANNYVRAYQFIITPETLYDYEFTYVGRERIDELNTYVFDAQPKAKIPEPDKGSERYLKGRVWVDDQDLQVVKVAGLALPAQSPRRAPKFETYFQNVDHFWFPAYISADDSIRNGKYFTHIVVKARFTSYRRATKKG